jgi:phage terminase large subunit
VADQPNRWQAFLDQYEDDAELFVREVLGVGEDAFDENGRQIAGIYPDQLELLQAYSRRDRRIAKRSGHGVGKTTSLAWVLVHHAVCRFPQKAVCTAPTSGQLFDALYSETVTWFKRLPDQVRELYEIKSESIELIASPTESWN